MRSSGDRFDSDTIVAIATPPGRGGIGVVRLSGSSALPIAQAILAEHGTFAHRVAHYRVLHDGDGQRIDDALITFFPAPNSYTGEDVVEIATHGSPVVLDWLVHACVAHGAVPARAGEFTERAFLSGRLDLTGAEAVRDLIEAQTLAQATLAAEQMGGSIAAAVRPVKQALFELIAGLEAGIDFAEDDISTMPHGELLRRIRALLPPTAALLSSFTHGRLMREGLRLAIVGEPNVGKSSLFNRLVKQDRAIVTASPGTTRDVIAERLALDGIPVELLDTAGLRETDDEAERIGVARSRQAMAEADAVLLVVDVMQPRRNDQMYAALAGRPVLLVQNKVDLLTESLDANADEAMLDPNMAQVAPVSLTPSPGGNNVVPVRNALRDAWPVIRTSTKTGYGILSLKQAIVALATGGARHGGAAMLTNLRQKDAVNRAHLALLRAEAAAAAHVPHEMVLLDLYEALRANDELTGETTADDVLRLIFSTFCIGK